VTSRGRLFLKIGAIIALVATAYCTLWAFSSADLAFLPCNGNFALNAPTFRCRQPQIAMILSAAFLALALALLWASRASKK
jgi:hypothetical protein